MPVRSIGVSVENLLKDDQQQLDTIKDWERERRLAYIIDNIKERFGQTALVRGPFLTRSGQVFDRAPKVGGHLQVRE